MTESIKLGDIVMDSLTEFEGTAIAVTHHINNCDTFTIQPKGAKEGKPVGSRTLDLPRIRFVKKSAIVPSPAIRPGEPVELGDTVQDIITGVKGIAMSRTVWLDGCSRIAIQPNALKDGLPADQYVSDERDTKVLKRANPPKPAIKTGGPRTAPQKR